MPTGIQKRKFRLITDQVLGRTKRGISARKEQEERIFKQLQKAIQDTISDEGVRGGQAPQQFGQEGDFQGPGFGDSNF